MIKIHIGIDDTDSYKGGCTTYIASILSEELDKKRWIKIIDYPNLIRLNPNIPFKTRGNGSIAFRILIEKYKIDKLMDKVWNTVLENSFLYGKTSPSVVFWEGEINKEIRKFYNRALTTLVSYSYLDKIIERNSDKITIFFKEKKRSLIGALAAIGGILTSDYTFELIAYRDPSIDTRYRKIDFLSVIRFDRKIRPYTFNNFDYNKKRILITPHGPDPVIFGIRGNNPKYLLKALRIIVTKERIERWTIFRTNQGTDAHLSIFKKIKESRPYDSVIIKGRVLENPKIMRGGHILFKISDETGSMLVIAYKETGRLCKIIKLLKKGDLVEVYGGIRPPSKNYPLSLNLEKIKVIETSPIKVSYNPLCPVCSRRMKSAGRNKGYKCKHCGYYSKNLRKVVIYKPRLLKPGIYIASPRAHRHLTKPLSRYENVNRGDKIKIIFPWHYP